VNMWFTVFGHSHQPFLVHACSLFCDIIDTCSISIVTNAVEKYGKLGFNEHLFIEGPVHEDWMIADELDDVIKGIGTDSNFLLKTDSAVLLVPPEEVQLRVADNGYPALKVLSQKNLVLQEYDLLIEEMEGFNVNINVVTFAREV
jgi:hypothetical protein